MKFSCKAPSIPLRPGWTRIDTAPNSTVTLVLGLISVSLVWRLTFLPRETLQAALFPPDSAPGRNLLGTLVLAIVLHKMLHIFVLPTRLRLRSLHFGMGWRRGGPHAWIIITAPQARSHYLIAAVAPFVLLGLCVAFAATLVWPDPVSIWLTLFASVNLFCSATDLNLCLAVLKTPASHIQVLDDGLAYRSRH
jgi:hypothetical protein